MTFVAGYELTFTNAALVAAGAARGELELDTPENLAACVAFAAAIRAAIGDHRYTVEDDGFGFPHHVFTYPDGYWVKLEIDPWVVELTGQPRTIAGYRTVAARLEALFEIAKQVGLAPHERIGGGHVHIAHESFGGDPRAIRNFIVDYCNHPELALGVLGFDPLNAAPLATAPAASIEAFREGLARFDAGVIDLDGLFRHLRAQVYTFGSPQLPRCADPSKYQAISVNFPGTIEIRAIRPQASFAELLSLFELFAARIAFLAGSGPIPYRHEPWPPNTPMPRNLADARFRLYRAELEQPRLGRDANGALAPAVNTESVNGGTMARCVVAGS